MELAGAQVIGERHKDGSVCASDSCRRAHAWLPAPTKTLDDVAASVAARPPTLTGWICPKCDGVNAPFVAQCSCSAQTGFAPLGVDKPQGERLTPQQLLDGPLRPIPRPGTSR